MNRHPDRDNHIFQSSLWHIQHFVCSCNKYFTKIYTNCLLAMILHPLMVEHGFGQLAVMWNSKEATFDQAKNLLVQAIMDATKKMNFKSASEGITAKALKVSLQSLTPMPKA